MINSWNNWVINAKPGDSYIYYRGFLPLGRDGQHNQQNAREVDILAKIVWDAMEHGIVTLAQKKHGPLDYSYLAFKLRPVRSYRPLSRQ
jgi:hypothetical protein